MDDFFLDFWGESLYSILDGFLCFERGPGLEVVFLISGVPNLEVEASSELLGFFLTERGLALDSEVLAGFSSRGTLTSAFGSGDSAFLLKHGFAVGGAALDSEILESGRKRDSED